MTEVALSSGFEGIRSAVPFAAACGRALRVCHLGDRGAEGAFFASGLRPKVKKEALINSCPHLTPSTMCGPAPGKYDSLASCPMPCIRSRSSLFSMWPLNRIHTSLNIAGP